MTRLNVIGMRQTTSSTCHRSRGSRRAPANITDGEAIKRIRYCRGLDIADLVRKLSDAGTSVHPDHLRNIELGRRNASPKLTKALADAFDIDPARIMLEG